MIELETEYIVITQFHCKALYCVTSLYIRLNKKSLIVNENANYDSRTTKNYSKPIAGNYSKNHQKQLRKLKISISSRINEAFLSSTKEESN